MRKDTIALCCSEASSRPASKSHATPLPSRDAALLTVTAPPGSSGSRTTAFRPAELVQHKLDTSPAGFPTKGPFEVLLAETRLTVKDTTTSSSSSKSLTWLTLTPDCTFEDDERFLLFTLSSMEPPTSVEAIDSTCEIGATGSTGEIGVTGWPGHNRDFKWLHRKQKTTKT